MPVPCPRCHLRTQRPRRSHAGLGRCCLLTHYCDFQPRQLTVIVRIYHLLGGTEGVVQIPIALLTGPGHNLCRFCEEELLFLQLVRMYLRTVFSLIPTDLPIVGPALMRLTVLAPFEVTIHCQFTGIQTQQEDLVGQREVGSTSVPDFPPPVCSSPSG